MKVKSLYDLQIAFDTEQKCVEHLEGIRWGDTIACPHCGGMRVYRCKGIGKYKCGERGCKLRFSITTGTFLENTKIPLRKWFIAMYLCLSHKKGISSCQLARDIGVTQKTAWFMLHRIRHIVKMAAPKMFGTIEVDETYVGGKNKNRPKKKRVQNAQGRSYKDKTPVFGMLQRGGLVYAQVVPSVKAFILYPMISRSVEAGSTINSDEWGAYNGLGGKYIHNVIYHGKGDYGDSSTTTNAIEGFWSHLKRGIFGIYHNTSRQHLQRYVDEFVFKYNSRKMTEGERLDYALTKCHDRLKYKQLILS